MALLTSLYLCSRTVYAAVGTPTGSGARVVAAAQTELPEGCLINGVITNETDLTAALKEFFTANKLPMNRVALIAGGSQFMHRILSLPAMSEKKRMAVLSHELASGGAEVKAPLDDYMLLSRDARTRVDTVLATRVEQSVIAGYDALAWVMSDSEFTLDINNPEEPKILCVGNNPDRQNIYGAALGLYNSRIVKLINKKGMLKSSVIIDELPTIYFKGLDNLIATARSNKVAVCLGFQDFSQLVRDYGDKEAKVDFTGI